MGNYKISLEAEADLYRIWLYGLETYGEEQADKYYCYLIARFEEIAENPFVYQGVDYIRTGYRRSVCGRDSIYYRIGDDGIVEIMSIIGHQDIDTCL